MSDPYESRAYYDGQPSRAEAHGVELEHGENCSCCNYDAETLNRVTDKVLAYRPKPKTKAAKRRIRRKRWQSKKVESSI